MWEKLRLRERDRMWGVLFVGMLAAVLGYGLLALGFPYAAQAVGISLAGYLWLLGVRRLLILRQSKYGPATIGPLSPDEKLKARSKLLKNRR